MRLLNLMMAALLLGLSAHSNALIVDGCVTGGTVFTSSTGCDLFEKVDTDPFENPKDNNKVGRNHFNDNLLHAFNEKQNVWSETYDKLVSSHYVFFDPKNRQTVTGWITFDGDILEIFKSKKNLKQTATEFGLNDVNYRYPGAVGLEKRDKPGTTFEGNRLTIDNWRASSPGDHIRVITAVVSEPGSIALLGLGLVGLAVSRRRRH